MHCGWGDPISLMSFYLRGNSKCCKILLCLKLNYKNVTVLPSNAKVKCLFSLVGAEHALLLTLLLTLARSSPQSSKLDGGMCIMCCARLLTLYGTWYMVHVYNHNRRTLGGCRGPVTWFGGACQSHE